MPSVTVAQRDKVNRDPISDAHLILLEFLEDGRDFVHRAAVNNDDVFHQGNNYVAADIAIHLPGSGEEEVGVRLEMSNISRLPGAVVAKAQNRIGCRIKLVDESAVDTAIIDTSNLLVIRQATLDSVRISAELGPRASLQEPFPFRRTTRQFFPGVWWQK